MAVYIGSGGKVPRRRVGGIGGGGGSLGGEDGASYK